MLTAQTAAQRCTAPMVARALTTHAVAFESENFVVHRGIGRGLVEKLLARNNKVIATGRSAPAAAEKLKDLSQQASLLQDTQSTSAVRVNKLPTPLVKCLLQLSKALLAQ